MKIELKDYMGLNQEELFKILKQHRNYLIQIDRDKKIDIILND